MARLRILTTLLRLATRHRDVRVLHAGGGFLAMWNYHPRSNSRGQFYVSPYNRGWCGLVFTLFLCATTPPWGGWSRQPVRNRLNIGDFGETSRQATRQEASEARQVASGKGVSAQADLWVQPIAFRPSRGRLGTARSGEPVLVGGSLSC